MNKKLKITKNNFLGIKNPQWWIQETPGVFQLCYPWAKAFAQMEQENKHKYEIIVVPMKNDYVWQVLEKKRSIRLAQYILGQHQRTPRFIQIKINQWKKLRKAFLNICNRIKKTNLSSLNDKNLWRTYNLFYQVHINWITRALLIEAFEPFTVDVFPKKLSLMGYNFQELSVLEQPSTKTFLTQERIDFLRICLQVFRRPKLLSFLKRTKKNKDSLRRFARSFPDFYEKLENHSNRFFWLRNNYKDVQYLSPYFYFKLLLDEIKKRSKLIIQEELEQLEKSSSKVEAKKKKIIKKLHLKPEIISTYKLLETIIWWGDERKRTMLIADYYVQELLGEIAKRTNLSMREIQYAHPSEIKEILLKGKLIDKKIFQTRRRFSVWIGKKDQEFWLVGNEAKKAWDAIFKKKVQAERIIYGVPASLGRAIGKARIVLDPKKDKFFKGEILITSMTRPEFVPLMRRAKAVVTNEGGITCHAAIVSRELGIPCVVGTKIATKTLKNGDEVLIRAHRGTVEKI